MMDEPTFGYNEKDAGDILSLLELQQQEFPQWQPVPNEGSGGAILFKTRTGGIAARSTTSLPHTFPSATVDLIDPDTGDVFSPNREETVYNMTNIGITHVANRPRQAKKIGSRYFVDVDDC